MDDLSKYFSKSGNLLEVKLVLDKKGCPKQFGFVTFSRKEEADEVLKKRKFYLLEKKINVDPAVKKEEHDLIPDEPVKIVTSARVNIEKQNIKSRPSYQFTITRSDPVSTPCCKTRGFVKKEKKPGQTELKAVKFQKDFKMLLHLLQISLTSTNHYIFNQHLTYIIHNSNPNSYLHN